MKRFFLLVLILDRAKCQSSLPINHGIDGLDGGSPLLFTLQSNVKSSQQMIQGHRNCLSSYPPSFFVSVYTRSRLNYLSSLAETDFLTSDVMHGEGNILAHLVIVGFKVLHVQVCCLKMSKSTCILNFKIV